MTFLPQPTKKTKRLVVDSRRRRKRMAPSTKVLNPNNSEATSTYKNLNHRMNYCKFNFCRDIEKNPGPTFIDPSKTLHAPYSPGNVGQQCAAISLCPLIHNFRNKSVTHTNKLPRTPGSNYEHWQ